MAKANVLQTDAVAPKPKRKYTRKQQVDAPLPSMQEVIASQKGSENVSIRPTVPSLNDTILDQLASGQSKADVLMQAIKMNLQQEEPVSYDNVLAQVEELFATLDTEISEEDLLNKLAAEHITLFSDDLAEPHFFCEGIPFRAPSKHVVALIKHRFYQIKKHMPLKKNVKDVFDVLESKARFDSPKISMFNRVAKKDSALYYDLCDKRFLMITPSGWETVPAFPLFRRYKHQQAQVEPVTGGDPWEVFRFLTIPEEDQLLMLVFLISLFVAGIAHPVLAVCGDQGSSKSFLCNILNRLIDPTLTERIIQPKNERDLIQTLRQKYVTVLDNISKIDQRVSDILCQVCTGGGVSYRQLYTDEGENIAQFRHVVIINSIRLPIVNADLMDRAIIIKLQRIAPENRRPEQDLWHAFNLAQPRILGGIFDTIVKAMAIYPNVKIDKLPRLADFAKWGYAIAVALGQSGEQFLEDFTRNVKHQNENVAEKNVLCQSIISLMEGQSSHLGAVSEVHKELKNIVGEDAKDETFPKLPHNMRSQMDLLRSTLLEHGITYHYFDRQKTGVKILISNSAEQEMIESVPPLPVPKAASPETLSPRPKLLILPKGEPGVADVPKSELETFDFGEVANA